MIMIKLLYPLAITSIFLTSSILAFCINPVSAKPNESSYKIGDSLRFDFKGCTKSTNSDDIICVGNFRSRNGEVSIEVSPGNSSDRNISITDSKGRTHFADEIKVGDSWSCRAGNNCNSLFSGNGITLVEGIDYKTLFVFKDVSLPSSKIPLFFFKGRVSNSFSGFEIKIRNSSIAISDLVSRLQSGK
jgi:hypothetical protein